MRAIPLLAAFALTACGSEPAPVIHIPNQAVEGLLVTINDPRAQRCFESELTDVGYRFEIVTSTTSDGAGELRWYPPSNDAKEAVGCWVAACITRESGGTIPAGCARHPKPPNKSLERGRGG